MTTEGLAAAAFLAGFFGSGHCFGMCGPLVVLLENSVDPRERWARRLIYNVGRGTFYVLLGTAAGIFGVVLTKVAGIDSGLRLLRVLAAALVFALGLDLALGLRLLGWLEHAGAALWQRLRPLSARLSPGTSPASAFGAGLLWGALPCGLVYSSVSLAAASGDIASGGLVMLAFWTGTLPALLVAGSTAGELARRVRQPVFRRIAGGLMMIAGIVALSLPWLMMTKPDGTS